MNPKPVVALHEAGDDAQSIYDYLEDALPGRGERFLRHYFEVTDKIASNPWMYPVKFDDYHRALVPKSNLAVYYFQEPERSVIVAIIDARRHPRLMRDFIRGRRGRD